LFEVFQIKYLSIDFLEEQKKDFSQKYNYITSLFKFLIKKKKDTNLRQQTNTTIGALSSQILSLPKNINEIEDL